MLYKIVSVSFILFLSFGLTGLFAQETIPATGGNATGSGGTVSYSIGQIVSSTSSASYGSTAPGVQQPFEISVVTGLEESNEITLKCNIYPNPASDKLTLMIENYDFVILSFQFIDLNGKLLKSSKLFNISTEIDMKNIVSGTYFLKVIQNNKEIKTFKIIKK